MKIFLELDCGEDDYPTELSAADIAEVIEEAIDGMAWHAKVLWVEGRSKDDLEDHY